MDSAILQITNISKDKKIDFPAFFKIVKAGFSSPRKQVANNLSKKLNLSKEEVEKKLSEAGIDPKRRAETLSVEEWTLLTKHITLNT